MNIKQLSVLFFLASSLIFHIRFFPKTFSRNLIDTPDQKAPQTTDPENDSENEPKSYTEYEDTAEKSLEFQKIKEEFEHLNPSQFSDKTVAQQKVEEQTIEDARRKKNDENNSHEFLGEKEQIKSVKVNKYPNKEIEKMVFDNENISCNRRILFSYLESMTDETYFSVPKPVSPYVSGVCPGMEKTCCLKEHFEELINSYKTGAQKIQDFKLIIDSFLSTLELINTDDVEKFSRSPDLIAENKCVGFSDLSILVKDLLYLKEQVNAFRQTILEYIQFKQEYFSGFVCHYCAQDAVKFFIYKKQIEHEERVTINVSKESCSKVFKMEIPMYKFIIDYSRFVKLVKAIRCEAKEIDAESMIALDLDYFGKKIEQLQDCAPTDANPKVDWSVTCDYYCKRFHRFTFFSIDTDLTNTLVESILVVKKKFNLKILAPNNLLAYPTIDNIIQIYHMRKDTDFNLDLNYDLNYTEKGLYLSNRAMNLTFLAISKFRILFVGLFMVFVC